MKNVIIIILLLLTKITAIGQMFITIEPMFFRVGILYNQPINKIGVYGHAWYGDIKGTDDMGEKFYTDNVKVGLGLSYKTMNLISESIWLVPYVGINYNHFFNTTTNDKIIQLDRIKKVSFEVGASFKHNRFTLLMMTDFINWESMIGVSYKLKVKPCAVYNRNHKK